MMDQLVRKFPAQLKEALEIGEKANIRVGERDFRKVYVAGMGGSGIGANFVAEFIKEECKIPYTIGKGYHIPAFVDEFTLAIVSSYSGNTEETISAFNQLRSTGARIIVIASGGTLIESAKKYQLDYIQLPDNWPSPRACLGYSMVQQLCILHKLELIGNESLEAIAEAAVLLEEEQEDIQAQARELASGLFGTIPIIYTTDRMESVAVRFRQQINENAKMLCWHHVIPEMNHNELVGWRKEHDNLAVVYLRNQDDYERNQTRIEINKEIISTYTDKIMDVYSEGDTLIERALYLVHLVDWCSVFLAELQGVDPVEIKVIDHLKTELSKV